MQAGLNADLWVPLDGESVQWTDDWLRSPHFVMNAYRRYNRFGSEVVDWLVRLPPGKPEAITGLKNIYEYIYDTMTEILNVILVSALKDLFRFVLRVEGLDYPISLPFMKRHELTPERIMDEVRRVLNSNQSLVLNQYFMINVIHVVNPFEARGRNSNQHSTPKNRETRRKRKNFNFRNFLTSEDCYKGPCLVRVTNDDDMCLLRAVAMGVAHYNRKEIMTSIDVSRRVKTALLLHNVMKCEN